MKSCDSTVQSLRDHLLTSDEIIEHGFCSFAKGYHFLFEQAGQRTVVLAYPNDLLGIKLELSQRMKGEEATNPSLFKAHSICGHALHVCAKRGINPLPQNNHELVFWR